MMADVDRFFFHEKQIQPLCCQAQTVQLLGYHLVLQRTLQGHSKSNAPIQAIMVHIFFFKSEVM